MLQLIDILVTCNLIPQLLLFNILLTTKYTNLVINSCSKYNLKSLHAIN